MSCYPSENRIDGLGDLLVGDGEALGEAAAARQQLAGVVLARERGLEAIAHLGDHVALLERGAVAHLDEDHSPGALEGAQP